MAYCHLRQDMRFFRLSRIDSVELLDTTFKRPHNFVPDWSFHVDNRPMLVQMCFPQPMARYVREKLPVLTVDEAEQDGNYYLTVAVRNEHDILDWVLMWGNQITVLAPESLRKLVAEEAKKIFEKHQ